MRRISGAAAAVLLGTMLAAGPAVAGFGAIAYSPKTGGFGFSHSYDTRKAAEKRALKECKAQNKGCEVAIWFEKACGAVAAGKSGGWGSAWGYTRAEAEQNAVAQCRKFDKGCAPKVWACTE